jgi:hypothetical protein
MGSRRRPYSKLEKVSPGEMASIFEMPTCSEQLVTTLITVELDTSGNPRKYHDRDGLALPRENLEASGEAPAVRDRLGNTAFAEEAAPNLGSEKDHGSTAAASLQFRSPRNGPSNHGKPRRGCA